MKVLTTDPKVILLKIHRFEQFKEVARCVQLVAMTALHSVKSELSQRYNSLITVKELLNFRMEQARLHYEEDDRHNYLLVFITSAKTSCGAMTSQMLDGVISTVEEIQESLDTVSVISIGRKGTYLLSKLHKSIIVGTFKYLEKEVISFHIAYSISRSFVRVDYDSLLFYFTSFVDTFDHKLAEIHVPSFSLFFWQNYYFWLFLKCDDSMLYAFYKFSLALIVLVSLDENYYCSLGSRIKSMELAVTNTAEIISALRVLYNKARQAAITNEIIEILNCTNVIVS